MLSEATAVRFDRLMGNGKTRPSLMACISSEGAEVEMIVKFAAGCEAKELSLVREGIGAMLAADLDLPVPSRVPTRLEEWCLALPGAAFVRSEFKRQHQAQGARMARADPKRLGGV